MIRRLLLALLIAAAPTPGRAQSGGAPTFDSLIVTGPATAGSLALGTPLALAQGGCGATSAVGCLGNLGLAGGTAGQVLTSNGLGAAPSFQAVGGGGLSSAAIDSVFGSAQGSILYRGASAWTVLTPGGIGQVLTANGTGANPTWATPASVAGMAVQPQGRLTLTSGTPILTSTVSGAGTIFYTPATGSLVPVWNGTADVMTTFAEVSQALSDTSKSPSAAAAGQVYDEFAWNDGGTFRVTRGPAWSAGTGGSNAVRGSGAGSTALTRVNGLLRNAVAITNGPAAGFGTYVGTIATDAGGATVSFNKGTLASGGGAANIGLWNAFNRVPVKGQVRDSTVAWNYTAAATPVWRPANGSTSARVTMVVGLQEDDWTARYSSFAGGNTSGFSSVGIGFNTTTAFTGTTGFDPQVGNSLQIIGEATVQPLGASYMQAIEYVSNGTTTFNGGTPNYQTGTTWEGRY